MTQEANTSHRHSFIVGIAGGSASGKSSFAAALAQALRQGQPPLRVEVIGTDRYFRPPDSGRPTIFSPSQGRDMPDDNHPDAIDHARLAADIDARSQAGDGPDVLIVEGLMVLHLPAIRQRLDLRLFVELDADERALRRLVRNLATGRMGDAQTIATYYRESARVGHARYVEPSRVYADLILRGDADFARVAPMVAAVVRGNHPTP